MGLDLVGCGCLLDDYVAVFILIVFGFGWWWFVYLFRFVASGFGPGCFWWCFGFEFGVLDFCLVYCMVVEFDFGGCLYLVRADCGWFGNFVWFRFDFGGWCGMLFVTGWWV